MQNWNFLIDGFSIWPVNWCDKGNNYWYRTATMGFQLEKKLLVGHSIKCRFCLIIGVQCFVHVCLVKCNCNYPNENYPLS